MKTIRFLIILGIIYSCSINPKEKNNSENFKLKITMNQDTLFVGEKAVIKAYVIPYNSDSINLKLDRRSKFSYQNQKLASTGDSVTITFTSDTVTTYGEKRSVDLNSGIVKVNYQISAIISYKGKIDTLKKNQDYWVVNKSLNKRNNGDLRDSIKIGRWIYWYDDSHKQISKIEHFDSSGIKYGTDSLFYNPFLSNVNSLSAIEDYKNGKKNGRSFDFHENGNLMTEGYFSNGLQEGYIKSYSSSGKLYSEEYFENGKKK